MKKPAGNIQILQTWDAVIDSNILLGGETKILLKKVPMLKSFPQDQRVKNKSNLALKCQKAKSIVNYPPPSISQAQSSPPTTQKLKTTTCPRQKRWTSKSLLWIEESGM